MQTNKFTSLSVRALAIFLVGFLLLPQIIFAGTGAPKILNYQGRLMDPSGVLLGGAGTDYCFKFSFYDSSTIGSGTQIWPSAAPSTMTVTVKNGVFNVGIGDTGIGGDTLDYNFQDNDTVYLNVEVASKVGPTCTPGDGAESFETLGPRQRIYSSGFAINATTLSGYSVAQILSQAFSTSSADYFASQRNFFSTSSADFLASQRNYFSTSSTDYYKSQNNFFATSSGDYLLSTYDKGFFFSTTSTDYWKTANNFFSTSSSDYWKSATNFFSTSSADYLAAQRNYFSTSSANFFVDSSSTVVKTYIDNLFGGTQTFANASTTNISASYASSTRGFFGSLSVGNLTGVVRAVAGAITTGFVNLAADVTGVLPVANGGTGWASLATGAVLYGNGSGAVATTSAGLPGQVLALLNGVPTWTASTTYSGGLVYSNGNVTLDTSGNWTGTLGGYTPAQLIALGFSTTSADFWTTQRNFFATSSADYWKTQNNFFSTSSATYFADSSTTIPKTYTSNTFSLVNFFAAGFASYASSTIGDGTDTGGLTVNGRATTTGTAYFAGRVGIGTAEPQTSLDVRDQLFVRNADGVVGSNDGVEISSDSSAPRVSLVQGGRYVGLFSADAPGNLYLKNTAGGSLIFNGGASGNTEIDRITNDGFFGIGTSSPGSALSVQGNEFIAGNIISTSSLASVFPFASSSAFTADALFATNASTTNLTISSIPGTLLKTDAAGKVVAAIQGTDYLNGATTLFSTTSADYYKSQNNFFATSSGDYLLATYDKGFFFSTTSADYWKTANNFFSTSSANYWSSDLNFFSTSSAQYLLSTYDKGYFFSTTSSDFFITQRNFFSTTSTNYWKSVTDLFSTTSADYLASQRNFFSTSSASYFLSQNQTAAFATTSADFYANASTTIAKTYTSNTFLGTQAFNNITFVNATGTSEFSQVASALTAAFGATGTTTITKSGALGVGSSTPWGLLSVNANGVSGPIFAVGSSSATYFLINNGGHVGIGTTTPGATFAVNGGGLFANTLTAANFVSTSTATSSFNGPISSGITKPSSYFSILDSITAPTGATGTAVMTVSNDNATLSSGTNVMRLNIRTPFGTGCTTGTTCPRFVEFSTGVGAGQDNGGIGVGSIRLSTAGTGITQTSGAADFAEYMQLNSAAAVGDLVSLNSSGQYQKAVAGQSLIGVISDNPAFVGNGLLDGQTNAYVVGFAGVIETSVSDANGPINAGDFIAASSTTSGVGVKLLNSGYTLGQALESWSGPGTGTIKVLVLPKYIDASVALKDYGGSAGGESGYWSLATTTGVISLASSTYSLVVPNATISYASTTAISSLYASSTQGFFGSLSVGNLNGIVKATAGLLSTSLVNLASDVTGILPIANGGTGTSTTPTYGKLLVGNAAGGYDLLSTSSLGIISGTWGLITGNIADQTDLQNEFATKIDNSTDKGFFFSTTSADAFAAQRNFFSTSSANFWASGLNFFSTSSAQYLLSTYDKGYFFSTTSSDFFITQRNFFSTSSTNYWKSVTDLFSTTSADFWATQRNFFSTTSADYLQTQRNYFSTSSANAFLLSTSTFSTSTNNYYANASNTIAKTYTNNTFTGNNTFTNASTTNASTTNLSATYASSTQGFFGSLSVGALNGILKATAGVISTVSGTFINLASDVAGILPVANGGTGWANLAAGAILYGNGTGAVATTTTGLPGQALALLNGVPTWTSTTTFSGGLTYANGNVTLDTTGDWTGTFDGQQGSYYLANSFSTTSANYFLSSTSTFSTTSTDFFVSQRNFFSTTSVNYWKSVTDLFSTSSSIYFINSSSTIAKTYGTSTFTALQTFGAGFFSLASSTIGNGTQAGGLYINGGATTTGNAYFASNVGIGTTSPGSILAVQGVANFTTGTTTFTSSGGISLGSGCFQYQGQCLTNQLGTNVVLTAVRTGNATTTWTVPSNLVYVVVELWGAGGGGGGGGSAGGTGGSGGLTNFGGIATSTGGTGGAGVGSTAGTGGIATGGDINLAGGAGGKTANNTSNFYSGTGGNAPRGGEGATSTVNTLATSSPGALYGGGGAGGGCTTAGRCGSGGGGGAYLQKTFTAQQLIGTTSIQVGVGSGGVAGAGGGTNFEGGGAGGKGGYTIYEYTATNVNLGNGTVNSGTIGQFAFYNAAGQAVSGTSALFYNTTLGNLGIGTTTPTADLSIQGSGSAGGDTLDIASSTGASLLHISANSGVGISTTTPWARFALEMGTLFNTALAVSNQGSTSPAFLVGGLNQNGRVGVGTSTPWAQFSIDGTNGVSNSPLVSVGSSSATYFLINNGGNVGVGTTSPSAKLSIAGNQYLSGTITSNSNAASVFPYASTTFITSTNASTTNLTISSTAGTLLKTDATGKVVAAVAGSDYVDGATTLFSTTSADFFVTQRNLFSTTSTNYWKSVTDLFSTTSAQYLLSVSSLFSTTSNDFWATQRNFFSTTSANYFLLSTTTFSTTTNDYYTNASTTIAKTYSNNTFTGNNIFNGTLAFVNATGTSIFASVHSGNSAAFGATGTTTIAQNGFIGVGTTSPFAAISIGASPTTTGSTTLNLFAISSSTSNFATSTLFLVTNTGSTTIANGLNILSGCFAMNGSCLSFGFSTTSNDFWATQRNFFSTTSANYFLLSTSTFSTSTNDYYTNASTTIAKTYSNNTFTGTNTFNGPTTITNASTTAISATNASTTNLTISSTPSAILKTDTAGKVVAAVGGVDFANFGYLFVGNSTSTILNFVNGIIAAASSTFANVTIASATTTNATTTNLVLSGNTSGIVTTNANGTAGKASVDASLSFTGNSIALNLTNANVWTGLQTFGKNASSTQFSATQAYFGGVATTTFDASGNVAFGTSSARILVQNGLDQALNIGTSTNGIPTFTISTRASQTGLVGVGTSTPWGKLSVEMGTVNPAFVISNQGSSSPALFVGGVNQNGLVGIGTSSPWATFSVNSSAPANVPQFVVGSSTATQFLINNGGGVGVATTSPYARFSIEMGTLYPYSFAVSNQGSTSPAFVVRNVNGNGNVGVGTSTPWALMSIDGSNGIGKSPIVSVGSSSATYFLINNGGHVGIGSSTPNYALDVNGDVNVSNGHCYRVNGVCIGYTVKLLATYATSTPGTTTIAFTGAQSAAPSFTAGATGSLILPVNTSYVVAEGWGGGGGGGGTAGAATAGTSTSVFGVATSTGGSAGANNAAGAAGGAGGTGTINSAFTGVGLTASSTLAGQAGGTQGAVGASPGAGGSAARGGGGGKAATAGSVFGGGGGGATAGGAGGGGAGYVMIEASQSLLNSTSKQIGIGGGGIGGTGGGAGGTGGVVITVYATSSPTAFGNDYAELFPVSNPGIGAGDIVSIDAGMPVSMKLASKGDRAPLAGVISTAPGTTMGDTKNTSMRPVGLSGRVPVKFSNENGEVVIGDRIAVSSKPGVGMKAGLFDDSVGIVIATPQNCGNIEDYDCPEPGTVLVFLDLHQGLDINAIAMSLLGNDPSIFGLSTTSASSTPNSPLDFVGGMMSAISKRLFAFGNTDSATSSVASSTLTYASSSPTVVDGFAKSLMDTIVGSIMQMLANAGNGIGSIFANALHAKQEICVDDQCMSKGDVRQLLKMVHSQTSSAASSVNSPVLKIQGNNPATINVGDTYSDLGALITAPQADLNLDITYLVDGLAAQTPTIDTSFPAEHTITYRVIDPTGAVGEATRTVRVVSLTAASDASSTPSTTDASSTPATTDTATTSPETISSSDASSTAPTS